MIDFSNISKKTFTGYFLRVLLKVIPGFAVMPVMQGALRGHRWIKGSGVNSYWLGNYEKHEQNIFAKKVQPGDVVLDIGANVGFYSLIASKIVGDGGMVYAFEPSAINLSYLKRHFDLNACHNAIIVEGAVSNSNGLVYFSDGEDKATGSINRGDAGTLVPVFPLDELVGKHIIKAPTVMKIDVEGGEFDVLNGAMRILKDNHPTIFLSTHNIAVRKECIDLLTSLGYTLSSLDERGIDKTFEFLATY
jgi:FkbM family methyltransferase